MPKDNWLYRSFDPEALALHNQERADANRTRDEWLAEIFGYPRTSPKSKPNGKPKPKPEEPIPTINPNIPLTRDLIIQYIRDYITTLHVGMHHSAHPFQYVPNSTNSFSGKNYTNLAFKYTNGTFTFFISVKENTAIKQFEGGAELSNNQTSMGVGTRSIRYTTPHNFLTQMYQNITELAKLNGIIP